MTQALVGLTLAGRYRIIKPIGAGGMGTVYEALHVDLNRRVAIKVLASIDAKSRNRFKQEARATAALSSPHIVAVSDFHANDGEPAFLVMELLEGETLATRIRRLGRIPRESAIAIGVQVLAALEVAHRADVVHRDIKPANVFLVRGTDWVKVLDFGVAKLLEGESSVHTTTGVLLGLPRYMAPEQLRSNEIDGRADLHAAAACLYEMLTGDRAFKGHNEELVRLILLGPAPVLVGHGPELANVIARGLAKEPEERWLSAKVMKEALASAGKPPPAHGRIFVAACGATVLVATGATAIVFASRPRVVATPPEASVIVEASAPEAPLEEEDGAPTFREPVTTAATHGKPLPPSQQCWCRLQLNSRLGASLCPTRKLHPKCDCRYFGSDVCGVEWRRDQWGNITCDRAVRIGANPQPGDPCSGFVQTTLPDAGLSNAFVTDKLYCIYCDGNIPGVPAVRGTRCEGFDFSGEKREGRWACD